MNEVHKYLYCTFYFEKKDSKLQQTHTVNRSFFDKRETLIVMEMDPGIWVLKTVELSESFALPPDPLCEFPESCSRALSYHHSIMDDLDIEFEIKAGSLNYIPSINIDTDCDVPTFSWTPMGATPPPAQCNTYTIELHDTKQKIDAEMIRKYPNLKPLDNKGNCLLNKDQANFRRTGYFRGPRQ
jgi:hypothetical protein